MRNRKTMRGLVLGMGLSMGACLPVWGQGAVTLPPSGDNQRASVVQHIGLVEVRIDYSSPDVTGPSGEDRTGKIWGELVPYGLTDLGFGSRNPAPWRAGANENTVFSVSHDVEVQGKLLAAGRYGLHMIPGEEEWTIIFSSNSTSWGSFFYDEAEDALRVTAQPEEAEFREWLTYDFIDRSPDRATVALHWENLRVPFTITVDNIVDLYLATIRNELRSSPGFTWQNWVAAATYCVQNDTNLEEALRWAETAVEAPFIGQANFATLATKAQVLTALDRTEEAGAALREAVAHPTASAQQVHGFARQLQVQGSTEAAVEIFKLNAERFGDEEWPVTVGLARAYSAEGEYEKALEYARRAYEQAPDPLNKGNLEAIIGILERGEDFNPTN